MWFNQTGITVWRETVTGKSTSGRGQQANKSALVCESASVSCLVVCYFLRPYGLYPIRLLCPWNSPGKNTGVGSPSLLQGIFLTQGLNLCLLYCRFFTAWATRKAPRILEWVAISFSRRSAWPRGWTQVSSIAGRFFTSEPPGKPPERLVCLY